MRDYTDPGRNYSLQYPDGWIALADEGSPHLNLVSPATGGLLHIEAHRFDQRPDRMLEPEAALRSLAQADLHRPAARGELCVATEKVQDGRVACADYDRPEKQGQFGHVRLWARNRGCVQVRSITAATMCPTWVLIRRSGRCCFPSSAAWVQARSHRTGSGSGRAWGSGQWSRAGCFTTGSTRSGCTSGGSRRFNRSGPNCSRTWPVYRWRVPARSGTRPVKSRL